MDKEKISPDFQLELNPNFDIMSDYTPDKIIERASKFDPKTVRKPDLEIPLFIVDFDQVIVKIDEKWVKSFIRQYPEYFEKELKIPFEEGFKFYNSVMNITQRTEYYIHRFLKINESSQYHKKCMEIYTDDSEFYDELPLTAYGKNLKLIYDKGKIRLFIISHCITKTDAECKKKYIERVFPDAPYSLIKSDILKSSIINKYNMHDYFAFVDDSLKNIEDVFTHTYSVSKTFGLPMYGYNTEYEYLLEPLEKNLSLLERFEI